MNRPLSRLPVVHWLRRRWQRFWFREIPPHIYSVLRISFGVIGVLTLIGVTDLEAFWWPGGLEAPHASGLKPFLRELGLGQLAGTVLFILSFVSAVAMTVGYRASAAVPMVFALALLRTQWNNLPFSSAEQAYRGIVFCLMWVDTGDAWSVDAWLVRRAGNDKRAVSPQTLPIWPLRLIRFQIAMIYLSTGLWKLLSETWREGSALHYVMHNNEFRRFDPFVGPDLDWVWTVGTYVTLLWELSFAFLLLHPWGRLFALGFGALAHVTMWALLELGPFSLVMLASYLAFLHPETVAYRSATLPSKM